MSESYISGPYINAETTAGGLAHWLTSEIAGTLRTNATDFRAAWQDYIWSIINITVPNQIVNGGPVIGTFCWAHFIYAWLILLSAAIQIDNEYFQGHSGQAEYFEQLEEAYHNSNIVIPLTYNDPGQERHFVNGTVSVNHTPLFQFLFIQKGAVDIYG